MASPGNYSRLRDEHHGIASNKATYPDIEMAQQGYGESRDYYQQQAPPQQNYSQQPPNYDQSYGAQQGGNYGAPNTYYEGGKPFEQQFKVERPKWNDVSV